MEGLREAGEAECVEHFPGKEGTEPGESEPLDAGEGEVFFCGAGYPR